MNHAELFVLHPIAYEQGQEILQQEANMVRNGLSPSQRIDFLQTELARLSQLTDVSMAEALASILPATYGELLGDINEMRARLLRHGCSGTLRSFRNLHRRYGLDTAVLDPMLVQGALGVLENDASVFHALEQLLGHRMEAIVNHPLMHHAEEQFQSEATGPELPSARDRRMMATAQRVLLPIVDELATLWNLTNAEVRLVAYLYGRILDVSLADILVYLVEHHQAGAVQTAIGKSVAAAGITHRKVLQTIVGERLHQLGANLASGPESTADLAGEHTEEAKAVDFQRPHVAGDEGRLLTVKEAMTLLNVSRQTIHRLVADGKLVQVKIGRAVRFSQHDLERFIGR